jgi:ornithine carbamoyltransferase
MFGGSSGLLQPVRLARKVRFMDTQHSGPQRPKVKSHMVQFIFEQVSLVTRASFWLPMNLTSMGGAGELLTA